MNIYTCWGLATLVFRGQCIPLVDDSLLGPDIEIQWNKDKPKTAKVTFTNGKCDEAVLEVASIIEGVEDECLLEGNLRNEKSSRIVVSGCEGTGMEVTLQSKYVEHGLIRFKKDIQGNDYVNEDEGNPDYESDYSEIPQEFLRPKCGIENIQCGETW